MDEIDTKRQRLGLQGVIHVIFGDFVGNETAQWMHIRNRVEMPSGGYEPDKFAFDTYHFIVFRAHNVLYDFTKRGYDVMYHCDSSNGKPLPVHFRHIRKPVVRQMFFCQYAYHIKSWCSMIYELKEVDDPYDVYLHQVLSHQTGPSIPNFWNSYRSIYPKDGTAQDVAHWKRTERQRIPKYKTTEQDMNFKKAVYSKCSSIIYRPAEQKEEKEQQQQQQQQNDDQYGSPPQQQRRGSPPQQSPTYNQRRSPPQQPPTYNPRRSPPQQQQAINYASSAPPPHPQ